jgi:eukaryotic-like serine/threonine-protein kinase
VSFRVWKGGAQATPTTPRQAASATPAPASLPWEVTEAGANRLTVLALLTGGIVLILAIANRQIFGRFGAASMNPSMWLGATAASLLLSFSVAWIGWRKMLSPTALLDLGLVYEVAQAFCISLTFHEVPLRADAPPRGWTPVAVFILAYPLIVPATRGKMILATIAAAAMDPLGFVIALAAGNPRPPAGFLVPMFFPTVISASVSIVLARLVYRMTVEAEKGHEMGSYHLEELLGRGGMGEVWRANHRLLARPAAIKLIRPESFGSDGRELVRRFEREAKATAALRSPHTVDIYDFGTTEDGTFYYVMELLEGFDLETLVTRFGSLPAERAVEILTQACHSLGEAHQGGLIHRDVKPANIYVCRYGLDWDFVKVLDFGLVKNVQYADKAGRPLTVAGVIAGTPGYMAPEMGLGNPDVDWRADIYALGCVGYWLLTGKPVFDSGPSPMQIVMDHIQKLPQPPSQRTTAPIPEELDFILLQCLRKDPNERPQTMQDFAESLRRIRFESTWTPDRARRWWQENASRRDAAPAITEPAPRVVTIAGLADRP